MKNRPKEWFIYKTLGDTDKILSACVPSKNDPEFLENAIRVIDKKDYNQLLEQANKLEEALKRIEEDSCDYDHDEVAGDAIADFADFKKRQGMEL